MKKRPATLLSELPDGAFGHADLLETVENQLRDRTPPETHQALLRLMLAGQSREDAVHLIACALSVEIFEILETGQRFDATRYADNLAALPELPYDDTALAD